MENRDAKLTEAISNGIRSKGVYGFVKLALQVAQEHRKEYKNNPDAIIHEDVEELASCFEQMASKHPLRFYDTVPSGE